MRKCIIFFCLFFLFYTGLSNSAWAVSSVSYRTLEKEIIDLIDQKQGTYGVYVMDLNTGQICGVNEDTVFHAASTFKVPVNLYLFQQIAEGKINPHKKLIYKEKHYEGGTGILQYKKYGSRYTIQELAKYSIVYSDNVATNMLLELLGKKNVKKMMSDLGGHIVDYSKNTTCPRDMAIYLEALLQFNEEHPDEGELLIKYLKNTVFNDRIPPLLPEGTEVAHKIGNWPAQGSYHDVGIVYHPSHPYIISLFSKDAPNSDYAYQVLQQISRLVYDAQSGLTEMELVVNGESLDTEIPPILANGTVYIPLLPLNATLNRVTGAVPEKSGTHRPDQEEMVFYPDPTKMLLNNAVHYRDLPPEYIAGHLMVPQEMVIDLFPVFVTVDTAANKVYITDKPKEQPKQPTEQQDESASSFTLSEYQLIPLIAIPILICCLIIIQRNKNS
ncbi:MAG: serine hydrolase [Thermoanaerobacterales bacterium]|jgi:beta-lactamase class A|nr:serine hydrolase [Thermoanaerobacterales bacterium]